MEMPLWECALDGYLRMGLWEISNNGNQTPIQIVQAAIAYYLHRHGDGETNLVKIAHQANRQLLSVVNEALREHLDEVVWKDGPLGKDHVPVPSILCAAARDALDIPDDFAAEAKYNHKLHLSGDWFREWRDRMVQISVDEPENVPAMNSVRMRQTVSRRIIFDEEE